MALPGYLEDTAKDYATQATAAYKTELDPSTFMGSQFVAGEDPLQTKAIDAATAGIDAYKPYLASAAGHVGAAGTAQAGLGALTGPGGGTGAGSIQSFMSPYQQDVIDTSLASFDKQAAMRQQQLKDQSLGVPGAFGGGREGVQQAQYQSGSDMNRLAMQAQMRQQNFQQAQMQRQQAFGNQQQMAQGQLGLGQAQMGLGQYHMAGIGQNVGAYGQAGSLRQGQKQAQLTADQQMKQAQAYEPYGRLSAWGQGLTGLAGGVSSAQYQEPQQASPWSSALSTALGVGGLYQKMFMPQPLINLQS